MEKFNIEKAKAGKEVVTRDGRKVKIICYNQYELGGDFDISPILALVEGIGRCEFSEEGRYLDGIGVSNFDIFMAPEVNTVWVTVWSSGSVKAWGDREPEKDRVAAYILTEQHLADDYVTQKIEWPKK